MFLLCRQIGLMPFIAFFLLKRYYMPTSGSNDHIHHSLSFIERLSDYENNLVFSKEALQEKKERTIRNKMRRAIKRSVFTCFFFIQNNISFYLRVLLSPDMLRFCISASGLHILADSSAFNLQFILWIINPHRSVGLWVSTYCKHMVLP